MMTRKRKIVIGVSVGVGALLVSGVLAAVSARRALAGPPFGNHCMRKHFRAHMVEHMGKMHELRADLDITEAQHAAIKGALEARTGQIAAVASDIMTTKRALRDEVLNPSPDEEKIAAAVNAMTGPVARAAILASEIIGDAREILTGQQIELIEKHIVENDKSVDELMKRLFKGEQDE